ncbi:hypothetical protein ABLN97_16645 [Mycobacterium tuberculosis]
MAALHAGKALTIAPQSMTLTTQQAADLLGGSRPTVERLVKHVGVAPRSRGDRPACRARPGVLAYREARRQRQYDACRKHNGHRRRRGSRAFASSS